MAGVKAGPVIAADVDPATKKVAVGGYVCHPAPIVFHDKLKVTTLKVRNTGDRPVQVGSHFHFFEVNRALEFDRRRGVRPTSQHSRRPRRCASSRATSAR